MNNDRIERHYKIKQIIENCNNLIKTVNISI